jgi:polysaccharide transporter, PST family
LKTHTSSTQDEQTSPEDSPETAGRLGDVPVSHRGAAAMFYVVSWGFASLAITFLGSLVLARHLTPHDFGLFAIGQTVATLATATSDGGIASGFIRQPEGISLAVLRSINGIQLLIAASFAAVITPIALQFGIAGSLTAIIVWSLPISSLQVAGRVALIRELRFRDIAFADALGMLGYYAWAITGVLLGHGVWSLASGMLIRSGITTLVVGGVIGWSTIVPSFRRYRDVLGVMGFGIKFSLTNLTNILYEQAKNVLIAVIGGTNALGLWALAVRVLQIPYLIFQPIHSVAFPAFSQFIASGRNPRPVLERVARLSFAASALVLPAFLVATPGMITTLFGSQWEDAKFIFPGVILSIFINAPVAASCIQFLYAAGHPSIVLRWTVISLIVNLIFIAVLFWLIGLYGIGFGTVPGAILESIVLARIVRDINGARLFDTAPSFFISGLVAVGGGFAVASALGQNALSALIAAAVAGAIAAIGCAITERAVVLDLLSMGRRSITTAFAGVQ